MVSTWDDDRGSWAMNGDAPFAGAMVGVSGRSVFNMDPGVSTYSDTMTAYSPDQQGNWDDWSADETAQVGSAGIRWLSPDTRPHSHAVR